MSVAVERVCIKGSALFQSFCQLSGIIIIALPVKKFPFEIFPLLLRFSRVDLLILQLFLALAAAERLLHQGFSPLMCPLFKFKVCKA